MLSNAINYSSSLLISRQGYCIAMNLANPRVETQKYSATKLSFDKVNTEKIMIMRTEKRVNKLLQSVNSFFHDFYYPITDIKCTHYMP